MHSYEQNARKRRAVWWHGEWLVVSGKWGVEARKLDGGLVCVVAPPLSLRDISPTSGESKNHVPPIFSH